MTYYRYCLFLVLLFFSCVSEGMDKCGKTHPVEIELSPAIRKSFETYDPSFFCYMDNDKMELYCLGDYYILKSILSGPTGRGSNYYYYLLVDKSFSKDVFFVSLSGKVENIWLSEDTLFANLLDFDDDAYYKGEYNVYDSCEYVIIHTQQSSSTFSLDTINEEKVRIRLKDVDE